MESFFYTQSIGKLYINSGIIFLKIGVVQFCNKYLVGALQNNPILTLEN